MNIMGNDQEYLKMIPEALKERLGEGVEPLLEPEMLYGQWDSVFKFFPGVPDDPYTPFEFKKNGTWSDGEENIDVKWKLMDPNILVLQSSYGPIPEADDPGGFCEQGQYVYSTASGKIIFSNADTSVVIQLTKK